MMMRAFPLLVVLLTAAPAAAQQSPPDSVRVYELSEVEVLPRPQNVAELAAALDQAYPTHLRQAGVGGTVHVAFVVGADGRPVDVRVVSTSDSAFSAPSTQAVSLLRFTPAQVRGRPVAARVEQPVIWRTQAPPPLAATDLASTVPPSTNKATDGHEPRDVEVLPRPRNMAFFFRELDRLYPPALRDAGWEGTVHVRFRVETDGTTSNHTVVRADHPGFVEPSIRAVSVLRFSPARVNGRRVRTWVEMPIRWTLRRGVGEEPDANDQITDGVEGEAPTADEGAEEA